MKESFSSFNSIYSALDRKIIESYSWDTVCFMVHRTFLNFVIRAPKLMAMLVYYISPILIPIHLVSDTWDDGLSLQILIEIEFSNFGSFFTWILTQTCSVTFWKLSPKNMDVYLLSMWWTVMRSHMNRSFSRIRGVIQHLTWSFSFHFRLVWLSVHKNDLFHSMRSVPDSINLMHKKLSPSVKWSNTMARKEKFIQQC